MLDLIVDFFVGPGNCVLAIPPLILAALIGAGQGMIGNREKQKQADAERRYQAETARWSPWTNIKTAHSVQNPSMAGDVVGGAFSGMAMEQENPGFLGSIFGGKPAKNQQQQGQSSFSSMANMKPYRPY